MPDVELDTSQLDRLAAQLAARGTVAGLDAAQAVEAAVGVAEDYALKVAPVDTGEYRAGIRQVGTGLERRLVATAPHSIYVEFGTSTRAPQPVIFPAGDRGERALVDRIERIAGEL